MFSVPQKSPAITLFPPVGNCFVSATMLTIYFLLRYFCIIHFSFQIDMQFTLKLNLFLVRLFVML